MEIDNPFWIYFSPLRDPHAYWADYIRQYGHRATDSNADRFARQVLDYAMIRFVETWL